MTARSGTTAVAEMTAVRVLVIDDDPFICDMLEGLLARENLEVEAAQTLRDGLRLSQQKPFDLIFLDVLLPDGDGLEKLDTFLTLPNSPAVIVITGAGDAESAERALYRGAWDYIPKPINARDVSKAADQALRQREKQRVMAEEKPRSVSAISGDSPKIRNCITTVLRAAATNANCLIVGETGTGKELFARAIHESSDRAPWNFVVVDCTNIPENLAESVLFGHHKGSFTDARETREGLFKQADKGTLFLDEIGDLPLNTQKSLLRVLQEKRFRPIGAKHETQSDFRLIAATNRDLSAMVEAGAFRKDLYYRLNTIALILPPLRERENDAEILAKTFIEKVCAEQNVPLKEPSAQFLQALSAYDWPGNVRELLNAVSTAVTLADDEPVLETYHLPMEIRVHLKKTMLEKHENAPLITPDFAALKQELDRDEELPTFKEVRTRVVDEVERLYFTRLLDSAQGDQHEACRVSGLSRARLYELLKKHHLSLR
ncbi:sigma-54-dependent transcriptional regulator [Oceanidesulfovibrio marinus]|uniref:Sigma-54-dependent Fis family transcriptional regulator n=1 Tax=Oceanidesulfovibrio marinus TaxID=370038 RepID=A0ABX6NMZ3_9BACT|nr:sigma-54 dependent transcriptional regulator [Oceanidesulfovibrio marinus]QJT11082.1 sigma-54-dependent Fis family transcriptional regulator [Oceanidesulfovibrio marinus]